MKLLNFAIATMIDANTRTGVNHDFDSQFQSKRSNYDQYVMDIRDTSLLDILGKIKRALNRYINNYKTRAREIGDTRAIVQLSNHMLKDIGLTLEDLQDLESGRITLHALSALRGQHHKAAVADDLLLQASNQFRSDMLKAESANQTQYQIPKCA